MFILLFIFIMILFYLQDILIFKFNKKNKFIIIRIVSTLIIGTLFYYVLNLSFNLNIGLSILVPLLINLFINIFIKTDKKIYKTILLLCFVSVLLELTLFNIKHYETITNKEITPKTKEVTLLKDDVEYRALEINIAGYDIKSLYFKVNNKSNKNNYTIEVKDIESNSFIVLNRSINVKTEETSNYKIIHNTYASDKLYLIVDNAKKDEYSKSEVTINPQIPIIINYFRMILLVIIMSLIYLFNPKSFIYKIKVSKLDYKLLIINVAFIFTSIILCLFIFNMNTYWKVNFKNDVGDTFTKINPYQEMAKSLSKGKVTIGIKPDEILKSVKNPYNPTELAKAYKNTKSTYLWDTAYYKGKYYCYYGIVPVILTYLPFYMITGKNLQNIVVMIMLVSLIIINVVILLKKLCLKYFKNISLGIYLLALITILFANHFVILYACQRADFYTVPLMFASMFNLAGINLLLTAKEKKLNKVYLFLGGLCLALVAGCRPQLLLVSSLSILIFLDDIKKIFKSKKFGPIIAFILPYILVAIPLMYYNYIRFDSPFDFGANYNLTTNNMLKRGFNIERIGLGLYYYLVAFPVTKSEFPFLKMLSLNTNYIGTTIYEKMFGGLFITMPLAYFGVASFKYKKDFKNKKLYYTTLILNIISLIIIILDVEMAGILPRYNIDFYILIMFSSILTLLSIINNKRGKNNINKYYLIAIIILLILNFNMLFIDVDVQLYKYNEKLYYFYYYLTQFWL